MRRIAKEGQYLPSSAGCFLRIHCSISVWSIEGSSSLACSPDAITMVKCDGYGHAIWEGDRDIEVMHGKL